MAAQITTKGAAAPEDLDYDEIEAAVLESDRGRWFLGEFAKRNRHAETESLLAAINQLQTSIAAPDETASMRQVICEMADEIAAAKKEIASIRGPDKGENDISDATAELDAIVESTETATSDILGAAEQIQELAWTLREKGAPDEFCDALDERATDIYTACSFQDITGQRTTKVVQVLQSLESRINAMARLWSNDSANPKSEGREQVGDDHLLLNGPARAGEGVDQDSVDRMIAELDTVTPGDDNTQGAGGADTAEAFGDRQADQHIAEDSRPLEHAASGDVAVTAEDSDMDDFLDDVAFDTSEPEADAVEAIRADVEDAGAATADAGEVNPDDLAELPKLSEKDYEALFS